MKPLKLLALGLVMLAVPALAQPPFPYFPVPGILYDTGQGMQLAPATGGYQGQGTLNAAGLFVNGAPVATGGTPGGSSGQVQYNSGGTFAGSAAHTWDNVNSILTLGTAITTGPGTLQLFPAQAGSLGVNGYSSTTAIPTIRGPAAANNSMILASGNSGLTTTTLKGNGYNSTLVLGQSGDMMYHSAVGNPYFFLSNGDATSTRSAIELDFINVNSNAGVHSGFHIGMSGVNATGCPNNNISSGGQFLPALGTNTCYYIMGAYGRDNATNYPLCLGMDVLQGVAGDQAICMVMLGFDANTLDLNIGRVTPVHGMHITSTGTSQASVVVGDTNTGSTTTIQGDAAGGAVSILNLSTGTNADFLCLSASGVVLIQASACTISSLRFKHDVKIFSGDALNELDALQVDSYAMNAPGNRDPNAGLVQIGLIAENVAKVEPKCAVWENDLKTPKSYRPECITALLVRASQEFHQRSNEQFAIIYVLLFALAALALHSGHLHLKVSRIKHAT